MLHVIPQRKAHAAGSCRCAVWITAAAAAYCAELTIARSVALDRLKVLVGRFRQNLLASASLLGRSGHRRRAGQAQRTSAVQKMAQLFKVSSSPWNSAAIATPSSRPGIGRQQDPVAGTSPEEVIRDHPILLNARPPCTVWASSVRAENIKGKAIKIRPLVCTAFNADSRATRWRYIPRLRKRNRSMTLMRSGNNNIRRSRPAVRPDAGWAGAHRRSPSRFEGRSADICSPDDVLRPSNGAGGRSLSAALPESYRPGEGVRQQNLNTELIGSTLDTTSAA